MTAIDPKFATVRAYYGAAIYQSDIRCTEEGVAELRAEILQAMPFQSNATVLISIPGGKA